VNDVLTKELHDLALSAAREASVLVRDRRSRPVEVADTKSSPTDVVTEADRASEELLRSLITRARPEDAVLGEEGGSEAGTSGVRWIVDPIDGTVNFLYGLPQYAVSVAAEVDGQVVAGVVRNAATGVEDAATLGGGATRDGTRIAVRPVPPLAEALVITGFNYDARLRGLQAAAAARLLPRVRDIRRLGSSALDICFVADGCADAYVEEGLHLWDHAAAGLIAREAGATTRLVAGVGGMEAMVVAPAAGFDEFLAAVTEAGFLA
jgi:myo-inositol-1(or 4)-monophosphatase